MSIHRILSVASVALVLVLVGCASQPASEPTSIATEPTPSAEPSPTPTLRAEPVLPLGGDCASVLTTAQLDGIIGAGAITVDEYRRGWSPDGSVLPEVRAVGTLGGIECEWIVAEGTGGLPEGLNSLAVVLLPAASVPADFASRYETPLCEPNYDSVNCRMSRVEGDLWVMARAGWGLSEAPSDVLGAAIDAAVANALPSWDAQRADVTPAWWALAECSALHADMTLGAVAGPYVDGWWEGSEQPEMTLLALAGVERFCPWYTDRESGTEGGPFYIGNTTIAPGAAWGWPAIIATEGVDHVTVPGAQDAVVATGFHTVYATDGVNIVTVRAGDDIAIGIDIAGRAMSTLAAD